MLFILAIVLLLALPGPWNGIGFAVCLVLGVGELFFWNRTVRRRPAATGAELLIGKPAEVISACRPSGQVRVDGEIWEARCDAGASEGDVVHVVGWKGLMLVVVPAGRNGG